MSEELDWQEVADAVGDAIDNGEGRVYAKQLERVFALNGLRVVRVEAEVARDDGTVRKAHYGTGEQPWDKIKQLGWAPVFAAANVLKYLRRTKEPEDSLKKARWYWVELGKLAGDANPAAFTRANRAAAVRETLEAVLTDAERDRLESAL